MKMRLVFTSILQLPLSENKSPFTVPRSEGSIIRNETLRRAYQPQRHQDEGERNVFRSVSRLRKSLGVYREWSNKLDGHDFQVIFPDSHRRTPQDGKEVVAANRSVDV